MQALWLLQRNLVNDEDAKSMADAILKCGEAIQFADVIPFQVEHVLPEVNHHGPVIPYGGTNWINSILKQNKWPLVFNDDFRYSVAVKNLGKRMFNSDAIFIKMGDFSPSLVEEEPFFIRPDRDLKEFAGHVMYKNTFMTWLKQIKGQGYMVNENTDIMVAKASRVDCEWRIFMCEGKAISGSQYRKDYYCVTSPDVPDEVYAFAEETARIWTPSPVCVIDVCKVNDELSVLEIGDFHSAGWYESDKEKIVRVISDYFKDIFSLRV